MSKPVHIGCSGWNYRDWRGVIYPDGVPARAWLGRYSELFKTVEVNAKRALGTVWAEIVNRTEAVLAPEAFTATQSILQANPNVNVILCIADDGCLGHRGVVHERRFDLDRADAMTSHVHHVIDHDRNLADIEDVAAGEVA